MKKMISLLSIGVLATGVVACSQTDDERRVGNSRTNSITYNTHDKIPNTNRIRTYGTTSDTIGFVYLNENPPVMGTPTLDRQQLASIIANVARQIPGVKTTTVLTTDNQVFVGCTTPGLSPKQAKQALNKVKMACENVSPRYYKVYTSNNVSIINQVRVNAQILANKTDAQFETFIHQR